MKNQKTLQHDSEKLNPEGLKELDRTNWNRGKAVETTKDSVNNKVVPPNKESADLNGF